MKKILFISFVCSLSTNLLSQSPQTGASMSAAESNRLNGTVQPTYQGGKSYTQWVAEEKAKQQAASVQSQNIAKNTNGKNDGVQSEKVVQPQRNLNVQGSSVEPEVNNPANSASQAQASVPPAELAPIPVRPDFSKNSGANNSNGTTPVEKVKPVNRTSEEGVGNNGTITPVEASKTKVITPAAQKTEVAQQPVLPVGVKLEAGPAEVKVATEQKAEPTQPSGNAPNAAKTKTN